MNAANAFSAAFVIVCFGGIARVVVAAWRQARRIAKLEQAAAALMRAKAIKGLILLREPSKRAAWRSSRVF